MHIRRIPWYVVTRATADEGVNEFVTLTRERHGGLIGRDLGLGRITRTEEVRPENPEAPDEERIHRVMASDGCTYAFRPFFEVWGHSTGE